MSPMRRIGGKRAGAAAAVAMTVLATAGMARAEGDDPFTEDRNQVGIGMLVGGYSVGPVGGVAVGMHLDLGRKMGPVKLMGEYDLLSIGETAAEVDVGSAPTRGVLHRLGLNARYTFADLGGGRYKPIQGEFWVEAGIGRQRVEWHEGGLLRRDDVGFGVGAQMNFQINKHSKNPKIFGVHYAFKAVVARSPDADELGPATCAGPCDEPSMPSPNDYGLFFNLGLLWGM